MKKNKIKLSLIDDYVKISTAKNFFSNKFENFNADCVCLIKSTKNLGFHLEKIYLSIFKALKLDDISFMILTKELNQNNSLFLKLKNENFKNINNILTDINLQLNNILNNLKYKSKILKLDLTCNFTNN